MPTERSEIVSFIEKLPKLSPEEERLLIRVCYGGQVLPLDTFSFRQPLDWLPVIELTGMPRTFKTSFLETYTIFCNKNGVPVKIINEPQAPFGKDVSPTAYNLMLAQRAADMLVTQQLAGESKPELVLIDRGIYNEIPFLEVYAEEEEIGYEDAEIASRYFTRFFGGFVDALIICKATPEVTLSREPMRAKNPHGRIMNYKTLSRIKTKFDSLTERVADLRNETLLGNAPFFVAELDSEQPATFYKGQLMRTIGSLSRLCTSVKL